MIVYLAAYALIPLFGWSLATQIENRLARIGFAFLAGTVLLTIEATLFSIAGIHWSIARLSIPLIALSAIGIARRGVAPAIAPAKLPRWAAIVATTIVIVSTLHFALMVATTQSVSADYLLFWGVKSVRFAASRSIDPTLLRWAWFEHSQREYPPLVAIFQGWGILFSGRMPWITTAAMSALWPLATVPVIYWAIARVRDAQTAAFATAFWSVAMGNSFAYSFSGGNAEAMLVAYLSVAAVAIALDKPWIAAIALSGAILTKEEALVSVTALIAGTAFRDLILRKRDLIRRLAILALPPAASLGLWFFYQWRWGLRVGYRRYLYYTILHFENARVIVSEMIRNLEAGSWWLSWILPLLLLVYGAFRSPRRLITVLPLMIALPLLFGFFFYVYLQAPSLVAMKISWTLPRISQPALSLLILAAAFTAGGDERESP